MDFHIKRTLELVQGDEQCCEDFPHCSHSLWQTECPECGCMTQSIEILGPYQCEECGMQFAALVEGWVDKRGES